MNGKIIRRIMGTIHVDISNYYLWQEGDFYDIKFELNPIVYTRQQKALDFIERHRLFDILINNPIYEENWANEDTRQLGVIPNSNELNCEQIQAIDCIINGTYHPVPYLLYGPPGKVVT